MTPTRYIIGSEPLQSWEEKHPNAEWIVLSGDISCDMYEQLCIDFDYTKYNRISFEALTFGNKISENEYQLTNAEYCHVIVCDYDAKLPVLDKMILGKDKDFIVSNGNIFSIGGETLYHMEEVNEIFLPDNVTHIADYAFANYDNLHKVHLNEKLKSIGKWAFCGTGIEIIELPLMSLYKASYSSCS